MKNFLFSVFISAGTAMFAEAGDASGHGETAHNKAHQEVTVDATAPYDKNNIFARILRGEAPAKVVYEDEYALAFHTIDPKVKVHILVIPKGPYTNFMRFTEQASVAEQVGLLNAIRKVSDLMGVSETGFRLNANTGHNGGQTVPHLHFHVLGGEPVPGMKDKAPAQ